MEENAEYEEENEENDEGNEAKENNENEEYEEESDEGNEEKENDESEDEEGKYYIKNTNLSEYNVLKSLQGIKLFPEIIRKQKVSKKKIKIYMPKYESKKIEYTENMNFVKGYIKSLLLSIKQLNEKEYIHGDIKPDNFLYKNSKEYHLIDFNSVLSTEQKKKIKSVKTSTFPFIPPETNRLCKWYKEMPYKESDLWSVGIILLFFYVKNAFSMKKFVPKNLIKGGTH